MKKPIFQFPVSREEYVFLTQHPSSPPELQELCRHALSAHDQVMTLILEEDQADDICDFCMNFTQLEGLTDDYSVTPLGRLSEQVGDKLFLEEYPLLFSELDRLKSIIEIPQELSEKLEELPSSTDPEFLLGIESASLLRDLCINRISDMNREEDRDFLKILIDRFYVSNRVQ